LVLSSVLVCSHCSAAPLSLHSFPTRRSSDLADHPGGGEPARKRDQILGTGRRRPSGCGNPRRGAGGVDSRRGERHTPGTGGARLDRKSTRLNSSHVKISYAVFCLKKKNQTES